jgi:hypothetical protein
MVPTEIDRPGRYLIESPNSVNEQSFCGCDATDHTPIVSGLDARAARDHRAGGVHRGTIHCLSSR